ncbi:electron transfer flavoprotein, alpha subunit [Desulfitobacterium dichloroeliminans LMG P-21439]|uniref:Electron transfer flavoprotein, alpha subunit n=1 Tax=Desulfitobacterium dichloroeliminans (strain LMG P-21439 / DCA1) TaxID=871963 RepID=L0FCC8_DESDL|nr:electron transfer flavoprotein subunit alpha/FixB family protein [Desulfitobacterium dichloroeliminans]AGA70660.1 electron transfer flavoprotein, alpha subunit [Desulfitobacterium dichloroeliminans LMG P-21439]
MPKGILVVLEQYNGELRKVSLELLSEGRRLADASGLTLTGALLGQGVKDLASVAASHGADRVIVVEDVALKDYTTGAYTSVLNRIIRQEDPEVVFIGNTGMGRDLAPRLAQRLGVGSASDCVAVTVDSTYKLIFRRPIYAGKAYAEVATEARPILATIRPNSFSISASSPDRQAEVVEETATIDANDLQAIVKEVVRQASSRPELTDANIIVSGGRAMKNAENFQLLEELADTIGAAIGASRAAVDSGYREYKYQVGQTGKTVAPTLYIACGISGAIQHLAGMGSSKVIVAINKDPEANIFTVADYGIVGDLYEIVPLLTEEFKKQLA